MVKSKKPILSVTVSSGLKRAIENASNKLGCSQGEFVRVALFEYLKDLSLIKEQVKRVDPVNETSLPEWVKLINKFSRKNG